MVLYNSKDENQPKEYHWARKNIGRAKIFY
jgi:hypothetical protein